MIYQSRKRKYTSRKERYDKTSRFIKIVSAFAIIGSIALVFFRRQAIWDWLKVFTY